ncbi:MAG: hypothetical protein GXY01_02140 [Clostridiales bacterium]|jgi:hypothetical protein|nr:hypothetical protein [Clostridiales bacterium]
MQKILEQIYNGELCPSERSEVCVEKFRTAKKAAVQAHDEFERKLTPEMKAELDSFLSSESDVTAYHIEQAFVDGFRLGAKLILEILEVGKDD